MKTKTIWKTIWKFPFEVAGTVAIEMPKGARVLHVAGVTPSWPPFGPKVMPSVCACLWALVDPEAATERRHFWIWDTGDSIKHADELEHLGTFTQGSYVWHLFEKQRSFDAEDASHALDVKAGWRDK